MESPMEGLDIRDQGNLTTALVPTAAGIPAVPPTIDVRERMKLDFYKTYDVMTGVRIAATLGGFFGLMILLVLYKNYCRPSKSPSEEQLDAAVSAAVEEEDRALKAALEATSFYSSLTQQKESVQPAAISPRFSSVGGGYSHLTPPVRMSQLLQRGKSLPGPSLELSTDDEDEKGPESDRDDEEEDIDGAAALPSPPPEGSNLLNVPSDRRLSSATTSSSNDSSYLERRGSAFELGLPAVPGSAHEGVDKKKQEGPWDFYYPIDIQVIQPTPEISPAGSDEALNEKPQAATGLQVPGFHDRLLRLPVEGPEMGAERRPTGMVPVPAHPPRVDEGYPAPGMAPLASISTLGSVSTIASTIPTDPQSATEPLDTDLNDISSPNVEDSIGSDSVFMKDEVDTEDEVEEFTTDSEFNIEGFDDDYSFCESSKKSASRAQVKSAQFASFDSCDASVAENTLSEDKAGAPGPSGLASGKAKKLAAVHESGKGKQNLRKTNSDPVKVMKQLPPWIEKGRSGYVPKRQFSAPISQKKTQDISLDLKPKAFQPEALKAILGGNSKSTIVNMEEQGAAGIFQPEAPKAILGSNSQTAIVNMEEQGAAGTPPQAARDDLPSPMSLQKQDEKRKRFQKQKTVRDDWSEPSNTAMLSPAAAMPPRERAPPQGSFLTVPQVIIDMGSCERLNILPPDEDSGSEILVWEVPPRMEKK